jgi:hypothetical protein
MIERDHLPERHLISSMSVGIRCDGDMGESSPSNRSETLIIHIMAMIVTIRLFLFQMAKLKRPISIYFGGVVVAQKRGKLTCEARAIANLGPVPERQKSRDKISGRNNLSIEGHESQTDAHPAGPGPGLGIAASQYAPNLYQGDRAPGSSLGK